jgi:hypothetical protein
MATTSRSGKSCREADDDPILAKTFAGHFQGYVSGNGDGLA